MGKVKLGQPGGARPFVENIEHRTVRRVKKKRERADHEEDLENDYNVDDPDRRSNQNPHARHWPSPLEPNWSPFSGACRDKCQIGRGAKNACLVKDVQCGPFSPGQKAARRVTARKPRTTTTVFRAITLTRSSVLRSVLPW